MFFLKNFTVIDPNYAVLIEDPTENHALCSPFVIAQQDTSISKEIIAAIIVSVGGVFLIAIAGYLLHPKIHLWWTLRTEKNLECLHELN